MEVRSQFYELNTLPSGKELLASIEHEIWAGVTAHLGVLDKEAIFVAAEVRTTISLIIQPVDNSLYRLQYPVFM
jgi:hypothetical protein